MFIAEVFFVAIETLSPCKQAPLILKPVAPSYSGRGPLVPQWEVLQPVFERPVNFVGGAAVELMIILWYVDAHIPCSVECKVGLIHKF